MDTKHISSDWKLSTPVNNKKWETQVDSIHPIEGIDVKGHEGHIMVFCANKREGRMNAKLIVEAGMVTNETGFTPRQLANQKAELLAVLKGLLNDYKSHLGENDCEPQQAGFILEAEALIKKIESST